MNIFEENDIVKTVDMEVFGRFFTPDIKSVIQSVRKYGFDIRVVGGAVRDFILGKQPRDVDFATDADPAELILIFDLEGIEYDAGGIVHGTVKGVFGDEKVDVTSITYKIEIVDGKMIATYSKGWEADARNRDLTINSLSLDMDGNIYDYVDGLSDIKNGVIRLNTSQYSKIHQDPNIIMRWFKALSYFDNPTWPKKDYEIIQNNLHLLSKIRDDSRTAKNLGNIMSHPNGAKVIRLMCGMGVSEYIDIDCSI